jgi:site-specific DNA-adenine methylase
VRYPGGKFRCFQKLINLIPPHRVYIETHLGGGAVLRNKKPAQRTIGIDRDPSVIRSIAQEFPDFRFILGRAEEFLESFPFKGDEFVYVDPPYWPSARRSSRGPYRFDYQESDHLALLRLLRSLPCRVLISGYANTVYNRELSEWHCRSFTGTSHVGRREETVWLNYRPTILHDVEFIGSDFRERQTIKRKRLRWIERFKDESVSVQQAVLGDLARIFGDSLKNGDPQ